MKKRDYRNYFQDIVDSIDDIKSFVGSMTFEDFAADRKTINAVIRSIEVIGEATKRIPEPIKNKYPAIPWRKMAAMRDKLIHEYAGVDTGILWKTMKEDIPPLKPMVQSVLKELG